MVSRALPSAANVAVWAHGRTCGATGRCATAHPYTDSTAMVWTQCSATERVRTPPWTRSVSTRARENTTKRHGEEGREKEQEDSPTSKAQTERPPSAVNTPPQHLPHLHTPLPLPWQRSAGTTGRSSPRRPDPLPPQRHPPDPPSRHNTTAPNRRFAPTPTAIPRRHRRLSTTLRSTDKRTMMRPSRKPRTTPNTKSDGAPSASGPSSSEPPTTALQKQPKENDASGGRGG